MDNKIKYIPMKEVAKFTTLSVATIKMLVRKKEIPHYRIGKRVIFDQQEIITWIKKGAVPRNID